MKARERHKCTQTEKKERKVFVNRINREVYKTSWGNRYVSKTMGDKVDA